MKSLSLQIRFLRVRFCFCPLVSFCSLVNSASNAHNRTLRRSPSPSHRANTLVNRYSDLTFFRVTMKPRAVLLNCKWPFHQSCRTSTYAIVLAGKALQPFKAANVRSVSRKISTHSSVEAQRRLAYFNKRRDEIVSTIRELVEIESPSDNKAAVDRVAEAIAEKFSRLGGEVRFHRAKDFGSHLQVNFGGKSAKPVLLLGHYDTVYPLGTLGSMP